MRTLFVSLLLLVLGCGGCRGKKEGSDGGDAGEDAAFDAPSSDTPDGSEPPPPVEVCDNELDDDGDGDVDCADLDCAAVPLEAELVETADEVPFADRVRFLWEGGVCPPVQRDVEVGALDDGLVSVVRGLVLDEDGEPFPGARVFAHAHESLGFTVTRGDGLFDFAVNAARPITITIAAEGHIVAQRRASPVSGTYVQVLDTVLVPVGEPSTVDLAAGGSISLRTSDAWGARTTTVFFPPGVEAETGPEAAPTSLSTLTVRPQEITVGDLGPLRMPGELPPVSAYTYAIDLDVAGADGHVRFSRASSPDALVGPVVVHVDNFLEFPVGTPVPVGTYERDEGRWEAEPDGRVIGLLEEVDGRAVLDFDGDGEPESEELLTAWGVTPEELVFLAETHDAGQSVWRVPTRHFSTSDYNWPLAFPGDAIDVLLAFLGLDAFTEDTCALGSEIRLERQVLGERFGIVGTPFSLRYASDRQRGYLVGRTLRVQVTPDPIPSSMLEVHVELLIAGQRIRRRLPAEPGLIFEHTWDGEDAYGRTFRGPVPYELSVGYGYRGQYVTSSSAAAVGFPQLERAFGSGGERRIDRSRTREDVVTWRTVRRFLTIDDARREGLLGLTLDAHHRYEPISGTLLRGDGGRVRAEALPLIIDTVAGGGSDETPGTSARSFRFRSPKGLAVGDDGQLYVATNDSRIWRVDRSGLVHLFAGNGTNTTSGDGGPAIDAGIANPEHLAWGPDGALYIGCVREAAGDECSRIRRVRADGVIETVAGNGTNARREGDGLPAVEAPLEEPRLIAFDPDGTLYFVDGTLYLRAVGTDGALRTLNPTRRSSDDRTPLSEADLGSITSLAVGRDSVLYVGSNRRGGTVYRVGPDRALYRIAGSNGAPTRADPTPPGALALEERLGVPTSMVVGSSGGVTVAIGIGAWIRRITPDGMLEDVAGRLSDWPGGDGGSAAAATLVGTGQLAQGPRGELFLTDINPANRVRRIAPSFGSGNADEWLVPSGDGTLRYVFSSSGRHLRTETATVGYPLLAFRYDPRGRLVAIDDADGNSLTISREADRLNPFAIRSVTLTPTEGPATTLHDDDRDGYADRITIAGDDDARATRLGWDERGLLTRHQDRFGITHVFGYDELGRLVTDGFEGYPSQTLEPFEEDERAGVTLTTAAGRTRSVAVAQAGYTLEQRFTDGVGLETAYGRDVEGRDTTTFPDGTTQSVTWRPDELLGAAVAVPQEVTLTTPGGRSVVRTVEQTSSRDPATGNVASRLTTLTHAAGTPDESTITQVTRVEASGASTTTVTTGVGRSGTAVQNERGELVTLRRPGRHPITLEYDDRGRLERASQGPEGRPELQRQITYALPSLPSTTFGDVTATDATGRAAVSRADTLGRPSAFADAAGAVSFDYEDAMRTETVTPPGRSAHRFVYDDRGRLERYEPPMLASGATPTTYGYDDDGVLERVTYPDGRVVESIVDGAGRFTSSTVTMGPASDRAQSLVASYDTRGVLDELTWTHDAATSVVVDPTFDGPLLTNLAMRGAVSANVAATFDDAFRLDTMTLSAGGSSSQVGYSYDDDGLHDGVLVDGERFALRLAPASGDRELLTTRGLQTDYRIDAFGGLEREVSTWSGQQLGWTQTFDLGGRVQTRTEVGASAQTWTYDYDDAGRLDSVTRGGDATPRYRYEYDANGNRIGWSSPTSSCTSGGDANRCVELDAQDRLRRYGPVGGADTVTLDYDSRGRLLVRRDASGTTRYDYDPYGNLRFVQLPSRAVRYLADPLGRRIAREVDGARTHAWVYGEGLAPLGQLDAAGRLEVTFIYLTRDWVPDLALHRDGTLYRVVSDPIGSVRAVVDLTTGAVVQRYEYSPFGEIERAEETRNVVPFRFAGGLYDELTGLTRFGARDYDARLGRWTAKDPIGFAGGDSNLYGYVANDPVNAIDPSGLVLAEAVVEGAATVGACVFAPLRDALAGCGNAGSHAFRCAVQFAVMLIPGVTIGMVAFRGRMKGPLRVGEAGRFGDLDARAVRGDQLTPHHMPQDGLGFLPRSDGGAIVMPHADHVRTRTYGSRGRATKAAGGSFRENLAADIRDIRSQFGTAYDDGIRQLIDYYKKNHPDIYWEGRR